MERNYIRAPKKVYIDQPYTESIPYSRNRREALAVDMELLAGAIRDGYDIRRYSLMRKLMERVMQALGDYDRERNYPTLAGRIRHSPQRKHPTTAGHGQSLHLDRDEADRCQCFPFRCQCPLEGDAFYNELYEQLKDKFQMNREAVLDDLCKRMGAVIHRY